MDDSDSAESDVDANTSSSDDDYSNIHHGHSGMLSVIDPRC